MTERTISDHARHCIIVVPCYNEEERLDCSAFTAFVRFNAHTHLLFVDDGSTDGTLALLKSLEVTCPDRISYLSLARNSGKAEAVRQGIQWALAEEPAMVGFWDADLATPLEAIGEFTQILAAHPTLDMVFGARVRLLGREIERRAVRHYLGRVFATAASTLLALPIYDTQCGAKLFRATPEIATVFAAPFLTKWIFDVELLARLKNVRRFNKQLPIEQTLYELPLQRWLEVADSKVRPHDFAKAFFELLQIYWTYLRPSAPGIPTVMPQSDSSVSSPRRRAA